MPSKIEQELQKASKIKPKPKEDDQAYFQRLIETVQELPDDKWEGLTGEAQNWVNAGATAVNKKKDIETFPDDEPPAEEDAEEEEAPPARRASKRPAAEAEEEEEPPRRTRKAAAEEEDEPPPRRSSRKAPAEEEEVEEEDPPRRSRRKAAAEDEDEETPRRTRKAAAEEEDPETETETEEDDVKKPKGGKSAAKKPAAKTEKKAKVPGAQFTIKKLVIGNPKLTSEQIVEKLKAKNLKASASAVSTIRSGTLQTMRLIKEIGMPKGDF